MALTLAFLIALPTGAVAENFRIADYNFTAPTGWERMATSSPMRKAQFLVTGKSGDDDGLVIYFHFGPGRGGSAAANINRWQSQFAEPAAELKPVIHKQTIGGRQLHLFSAAGTLIGPGQRKIPGYALLAAILESPAGDVYIRFTGPRALVEGGERTFRAMAENAMRARGS